MDPHMLGVLKHLLDAGSTPEAAVDFLKRQASLWGAVSGTSQPGDVDVVHRDLDAWLAAQAGSYAPDKNSLPPDPRKQEDCPGNGGCPEPEEPEEKRQPKLPQPAPPGPGPDPPNPPNDRPTVTLPSGASVGDLHGIIPVVDPVEDEIDDRQLPLRFQQALDERKARFREFAAEIGADGVLDEEDLNFICR